MVRPFSNQFHDPIWLFYNLTQMKLLNITKYGFYTPIPLTYSCVKMFLYCTVFGSFVPGKSEHLTCLVFKTRFIWFHGATDVEWKNFHVFIFSFGNGLLPNLSRKSQNQLSKFKLQCVIISRHSHIIPPVELFWVVTNHI